MVSVEILRADEDADLADALVVVLVRAGHNVSGESPYRLFQPTVVIWTRRSRASVRMQRAYNGLHHVIVLCDDASPPGTAFPEQCVDLRGWRGDPDDPRLAALLRQVMRAVVEAAAEEARFSSTPTSDPLRAGLPQDDDDAGFASAGAGPRLSAPESAPAPPAVPPSPSSVATPPPARLEPASPPPPAAAGGGFFGALRRIFGISVAQPSASTPSVAIPPLAVRPTATRVALAATAPRGCRAGTPFVAALSAYVEVARERAMQHLVALGESGDRLVADVPASTWLVGAPVCVRLAAAGATVHPVEHRGVWDGRELLAPFTVTVEPRASSALVLQFAVFVADLPVAVLPLRVTVDGSEAAPSVTKVRTASSAFASYASRDADVVTQRLSTLARWAPGLDIFLDCLDLRPGEDFKPQLASQIAERDVFLLFWSRHAAASPWVRWEFETAVSRKHADAILPMPIEDPAIAPLPHELSEQHLRDRYLLAGHALRHISSAAAVPPLAP